MSQGDGSGCVGEGWPVCTRRAWAVAAAKEVKGGVVVVAAAADEEAGVREADLRAMAG